METCNAAVITEHNKPLTIQKVQIPNLDPGSLLIKITASTLCGTDVHRWHGPLGERDTLPIVTGHEPCGTVEDIAGERTDILGNRSTAAIAWSGVMSLAVLVITARSPASLASAAAAPPGAIIAAISIPTCSAAAPNTCTCPKNA